MAPLRSLSNPVSSFDDPFAKTSARAGEVWFPYTGIIGSRALIGGGWIPSSPDRTNDIQYFNIGTTGNASQFGDLSAQRTRITSCQSSGRGVFFGGNQANPNGYVDTIEYITVAVTGNTTDFGNLTTGTNTAASVASPSRGVCGGGYSPSPVLYTNVIEYITFISTGDATDFGDLTDSRNGLGGVSNGTRGCFMGGWPAPNVSGATDTIDYITIASTGNATNFGDLLTGNHSGAYCSPGVYGYFIGGDSTPYTPARDKIQRITIDTTGNSTEVGELTFLRVGAAGAATASRGICAGGESVWPYNNDGYLNQIEYFAAAGGDSSDFGDLSTRVYIASGMSGQ